STAEQRAFVDRVFAEIEMTADGTRLRVSPRSFTFPEAAAVRTGDGVVAIRASAALPVNSQGAHHLAFDNGYRRDISVYLANALVPETNRIAVTGQQRDGIQSRLTIAYEARTGRQASLPYAILTVMVAAIAIGSRHARLL